MPAHKDLVVCRGTITVDVVQFLLAPWRGATHAVHDTWMLHVCIVLKKLSMHLWTLEGAADTLGDKVIIDHLDSRTFERADTKTFAV